MLMYVCVVIILCKSGVSCIDVMVCCGRFDDVILCNRIDEGDLFDFEMRGFREVRILVSRIRFCFNI